MEDTSATPKECPLCENYHKSGYCPVCGWEPSHFLDMSEEMRQSYNKRFEIMKDNWTQLQVSKKAAHEAVFIVRELEAQLNKKNQETIDKAKQISELNRHLNKSKGEYSSKLQKLQSDLENAQKNVVYQAVPPSDLVVADNARDGANLKWSYPAGQDVKFIVMRKQGSIPTSLNDGDILGCTEKTEWEDDSLPAEVPCFYVVMATHGKALSKPAKSGEIIISSKDSISPVKGLEAQNRGSHILLLWEWPQDVFAAQVSWRHDKYPETPHDSRAKKVEYILSSQYDHKGGFKIDNPERRPYWFTVYSCSQDGEKKRFSAGAHFMLDPRS